MIKFVQKAEEMQMSVIILNPNEGGKPHADFIFENYLSASALKGKITHSKLYVIAHSAGGWVTSHLCDKYSIPINRTILRKAYI
jgi:hypothetical protein